MKIWVSIGELKQIIRESIELDVDCAICKMAGKKHPHLEESDDDEVNEAVGPSEVDDAVGPCEAEAEDNPWAICTSKVGRGDKAKYERCVKGAKKGMK